MQNEIIYLMFYLCMNGSKTRKIREKAAKIDQNKRSGPKSSVRETKIDQNKVKRFSVRQTPYKVLIQNTKDEYKPVNVVLNQSLCCVF